MLFFSFMGMWQLQGQSISGIILDSATQSPIPYVNIVDLNTGVGTFTNVDDSFNISVREFPAT